MQGIVIKNTGSWYVVRLDDGQLFQCKVKGNFRLKGIRSTNPVAVGDNVVFDMREDGTAYIVDILERKNYIVRKASNLSKQSHILAANLDLCFLIVTISHPTTATTFIDRFLAAAEAYRVPVVLVFNKVDLYNDAEREELDYLTALYESIGYKCLHTSALSGSGIDDLKERVITTTRAPKNVFNDDPERILRLIRFACSLGLNIPEEEWFYAKQNAYKIKYMSKFRLKNEFEKVL